VIAGMPAVNVSYALPMLCFIIVGPYFRRYHVGCNFFLPKYTALET
jgi:hypothetical protein